MNDLTAIELNNLMISYMTNTMASVVSEDLLKKAENPEVKEMLEFALKIANEEVKGAETFLTNDNRALPEPFTAKDILLRDTKYYSDNFVIILKYKLGHDALNLYVLSMTSSTNLDISAFYKKLLYDTIKLVEQCQILLIKNGLHHPLIYLPRQGVGKIHEKEFLGELFGKNRSLSTLEIFPLVNNYTSTEVFRAILRSFVKTKTIELSEHFERGAEMCSKQLETIQEKLEKEDLPQLPTWESEIDTVSAPFSERLMLFKTALLAGAAGGRYGVSASAVLRKDIGISFLKLMGQTQLYAEDTGNLLVKYKMLDQPPLVKGE